jgi:hypothetical protein
MEYSWVADTFLARLSEKHMKEEREFGVSRKTKVPSSTRPYTTNGESADPKVALHDHRGERSRPEAGGTKARAKEKNRSLVVRRRGGEHCRDDSRAFRGESEWEGTKRGPSGVHQDRGLQDDGPPPSGTHKTLRIVQCVERGSSIVIERG